MENMWIAVGVALVAGVIIGWVIARFRGQAASSVEAAQSRAEAATARAEASKAAADVAVARSDAADARAQAADARAELAQARAQAAAAVAEREAARQRAEEIAQDREGMEATFKALSTDVIERQGLKAEASAEQRLRATEALMAPVKESLEKFNARLNEVETQRAAMTAELRGQVSEVKNTGEQLRRETNALVTALRKPQVRGAWGELQLKRVVEIAGMVEYCDFVQQETSHTAGGTTIRPDMKVWLGDGKFVYVDSKMPLVAFLDAYETDDDSERARLLAQFAATVKGHVDQLSSKGYFTADTGSPEFVVLFMASEALAAEALGQLPDLLEYAAGRNIVLATPTTLIAMLRAIAYSWRQAALADSAAEVFALGRELYERLGTMGSHLDKLGRSLGSAVSAYNETVGSVEGRVFPTARKLRDLKVTDAELDALEPRDVTVRPLGSPELIESATAIPSIIGRAPSGRQPPDDEEGDILAG